MKRIISLTLCLLLIFALAGCGASKNSPDSGFKGVDSGDGWDDSHSVNVSEESTVVDATKMIYTASLELETLEFDKAMDDITALAERYGGYFEEQTVAGYSSGYRYARLTVRVPSEHFTAFYSEMGSVCHTVRRDSSQQNISEAYYDVESRLNTAKTKLARLQELLAEAGTMADIITIESAISETEQVIDNLSGTLRNYDHLVDYATVTVELDEVYRLSGTGDAPLTLGQRLGGAFVTGLQSVGEFFESVLVWLAYSWLWLVILAAIIIVCIRLAQRKRATKIKRNTDTPS
ncbi:MAG: DUF4349 domain-containing protein [Oscillospiraceae bacterium]|nr:DUF4349 domain-containing protein [Oscillospiraceae bacterium]